MSAGHRVGVDIGGTFTDLVLIAPDGSFRTRKVPSTTDDYGRGIVDGLRSLLGELRASGSSLQEVIHGTTVATNAILEYKGAKTALLGGTVIIEAVFAWPGMGTLAITAIRGRDYPTIMAINLISALMVLTSNLLADLVYAVIDPRIRYA